MIVRDSPADRRFFEQLVENLQREDLTDQEEANAYRHLREQDYGVREIAAKLGVSHSRVSRVINLYAREDLADAVIAGQLRRAEAQELVPVRDEARRREAIARVVDAREGGERVTSDTVRRIAREARGDVMVNGAGRTTPQVVRPALVTLNNLARTVEGFCDNHAPTAYSAEEREPLRRVWERLGALYGWREEG